MPTFRKGKAMMWFPAYSRWLTKKEALGTMGFPVYKFIADSYQTDMLACDPDDVGWMLGNAMHLPVMAVITTVVLSCVQLRG